MDNNTLSLIEKFGVTKLDVSNRTFAGACVNKKISTACEHIEIFREYFKNKDFDKQSQVAVLHFLKFENKLIAFIDSIPFLPYRRANQESVIESIIEQMPTVSSVYLYKYPDTISHLYQRK